MPRHIVKLYKTEMNLAITLTMHYLEWCKKDYGKVTISEWKADGVL